jgi:hypothetical protein
MTLAPEGMNEGAMTVRPVRPDWLVPLLLAVLATVAVVVSIEPFPVGVYQDDGIYTVLAKSLATGQGYRYLQMPDAPNATHFPPAYPVFLAGLWKLAPSFPANVTLFKFANAALIGLSAVLAWVFARRWLGMGALAAATSVAVFTACAPVVLVSVMVMSEPLFLAALFPVLMAGERAVRTGGSRDALIAGATGGALALVRTLGIVVIPATALVLVWRRRFLPALLVGLAGGLVMLPWQLWVSVHAAEVPSVFLGRYGSYATWLLGGIRDGGMEWVATLAWFNLRLFVGGGWDILAVNGLPLAMRFIVTFIASVFFAWGWWLMLRRAPVAALMVVGYLALVVMWPFPPQRFTFGIWPLLGLIFGLAVASIGRWRPQRRPLVALRWAGVGLAALLLMGYARSNYQSASRGWWTNIQGYVADRAKPAVAWVLANTREDAVIVTEDDVLVHLYTGRRAIPIGTFTPTDHMAEQTTAFATATLRTILRAYDVDYVVTTTPAGALAAQGLVHAATPDLRLSGTLSLGAIYEPVKKYGGY